MSTSCGPGRATLNVGSCVSESDSSRRGGASDANRKRTDGVLVEYGYQPEISVSKPGLLDIAPAMHTCS